MSRVNLNTQRDEMMVSLPSRAAMLGVSRRIRKGRVRRRGLRGAETARGGLKAVSRPGSVYEMPIVLNKTYSTLLSLDAIPSTSSSFDRILSRTRP